MTIDDTLAPTRWGAHIWSAENLPWRLLEVGAAGALGCVLGVLVWLGVRPDLSSAVMQPVFWIKVVYAGALALFAGLAVCRLARERRGGLIALGLAGMITVGMQGVGLAQALALGSEALLALYWPTALLCLVAILALATPMLLFTSYGLAQVDPERPRLVGFAGGAACGGLADLVFGLHCPFSTFAFIAPWHTGGIGLCGLVGMGLVALFRRMSLARATQLLAAE